MSARGASWIYDGSVPPSRLYTLESRELPSVRHPIGKRNLPTCTFNLYVVLADFHHAWAAPCFYIFMACLIGLRAPPHPFCCRIELAAMASKLLPASLFVALLLLFKVSALAAQDMCPIDIEAIRQVYESPVTSTPGEREQLRQQLSMLDQRTAIRCVCRAIQPEGIDSQTVESGLTSGRETVEFLRMLGLDNFPSEIFCIDDYEWNLRIMQQHIYPLYVA